jgi:hypothetical protein
MPIDRNAHEPFHLPPNCCYAYECIPLAPQIKTRPSARREYLINSSFYHALFVGGGYWDYDGLLAQGIHHARRIGRHVCMGWQAPIPGPKVWPSWLSMNWLPRARRSDVVTAR